MDEAAPCLSHPPAQQAFVETDTALQSFTDLIQESTIVMGRVFSKGYILLYVSLGLLLGWLILPDFHNNDHLSTHRRTGDGILNFFAAFEGYSECNVRASELYATPKKDRLGFYEANTFCHDRKHLLRALSEGGRIGFDAPYQPRGCNYRWFDPEEMCFILERVDGLIFVGDDTLQTIYSGFNILLRRDLALGALDLASMDKSLQEDCRCNNQFVRSDCQQHSLLESDRASQDDHVGSAYFCNRIKHAFLRVDSAEPASLVVEKFQQLAPKASRSKYRPIPVIHSLGPSTLSVGDAEASLLRFVELADESDRNTPMLWIGPTAAGHIDLKDRKGNQEIWDFDRKMTFTAQENEVDVLGMWNMTVQATSWDGMRFGEKVAITQAMMVMNWLSRLESS
ncbi:hypothetical protein LTR64_000488 [Lithohypha guttulata]|uniref:uncharacterized protein n=1 Tax=Lithohypha guttulata TaxID=1690604 RepID=UPI002DDEE727|nr:hypothetical protein LTR51_005745 [Lithohypha guttulata]